MVRIFFYSRKRGGWGRGAEKGRERHRQRDRQTDIDVREKH